MLALRRWTWYCQAYKEIDRSQIFLIDNVSGPSLLPMALFGLVLHHVILLPITRRRIDSGYVPVAYKSLDAESIVRVAVSCIRRLTGTPSMSCEKETCCFEGKRKARPRKSIQCWILKFFTYLIICDSDQKIGSCG
jgi:hypothetical protein